MGLHTLNRMKEAKTAPISWKPLGAIAAEIVHRIGLARLDRLWGEINAAGPAVTGGGAPITRDSEEVLREG